MPTQEVVQMGVTHITTLDIATMNNVLNKKSTSELY